MGMHVCVYYVEMCIIVYMCIMRLYMCVVRSCVQLFLRIGLRMLYMCTCISWIHVYNCMCEMVSAWMYVHIYVCMCIWENSIKIFLKIKVYSRDYVCVCVNEWFVHVTCTHAYDIHSVRACVRICAFIRDQMNYMYAHT